MQLRELGSPFSFNANRLPMKAKFLNKTLIALSCALFTLPLNAKPFKKADNVKSESAILALTEDQAYQLSHSIALYSLFMVDQSYNVSDQYIDRVVATAKDMTDIDFGRVFAELKLNTDQKSEFNKYIADQRKKNGFDLRARVNLLIRADNARMQNRFIELGHEVPPKPENFKEFDIDDYYNLKFDTYMLGISKIMYDRLDQYETKQLEKTSGVLAKQSLINMVNNSPFKPKLRNLIVQEIKERELGDVEKSRIVFWCNLIKGYSADESLQGF